MAAKDLFHQAVLHWGSFSTIVSPYYVTVRVALPKRLAID